MYRLALSLGLLGQYRLIADINVSTSDLGILHFLTGEVVTADY
jgi:hypothetical protein